MADYCNRCGIPHGGKCMRDVKTGAGDRPAQSTVEQLTFAIYSCLVWRDVTMKTCRDTAEMIMKTLKIPDVESKSDPW